MVKEKVEVRLFRLLDRDKTGKRATMLKRIVDAGAEVAVRFGVHEDEDTYAYEDQDLIVAVERVAKIWRLWIAENFDKGRVVFATPILRIHHVQLNYTAAQRWISKLESMVALELLAEAAE